MGLSPTRLFKPFGLERAKAVIAAVSGGSDSLGMLFLLKDYLSIVENSPALIAVTVDHRLRVESALEAENAGLLCLEHGIAHRILPWEDPKPSSGIAAAARTARYRLLVQAAQEAGADFIVTGHTEDDQIETFLMRKERSIHAGARGLAAMSARSRLENSVELVRPLLSVSRQALRDELTRREVSWVDDPSNTNIDYERPRVRLGAAAEADRHAVLEQIARAGMAREQDNQVLVTALADPAVLEIDETGTLVLDSGRYAALPQSARRLFSGLLASIAGGRRFLPGDSERSRIERILSEGNESERLTVFGALIERGANGAPHRFRRERRNLSRLGLNPGDQIIWDGRFRISNTCKRVLEVAAPGRQELLDFLKVGSLELEIRKREGLLISPALYEDGKLLNMPFLLGAELPQGVHIERHFAIFDHVLPGHDFALARAVKARIGRVPTGIA